MKKALFITNHMENFAGSEIVVLELAETFKKKGFETDIFANYTGEPMQSECKRSEIPLLTGTPYPNPTNYDLVYAQHNILPLLLEGAVKENIKRPYFIYGHLSPFEPLEAPGVFSERILADQIYVNSKEVFDEMQSYGIDPERLKVFYNACPSEYFKANQKTPVRLKKIAIVSHHVVPELYEASELLRTEGYEIEILGSKDKLKRINKSVIENFDATITIGKTVQYSIAAERPVFCYDHFGGPGWLTIKNYESAETRNYSGRCSQRKMTGTEIVSTIKSGFEEAAHDVKKIKSLTKLRYCLDYYVDEIISNINKQNGRAFSAVSSQFLGQLKSEANISKLVSRNLAGEHSLIKANRALVLEAKNLNENIQNITETLNKTENVITEIRNQTEKNIAKYQNEIEQLKEELRLTRQSISWKITQPLRAIWIKNPKIARFLRRSIKIAWWSATGQILHRLRLRRDLMIKQKKDPVTLYENIASNTRPYYIDPKLNSETCTKTNKKVAIHFHLPKVSSLEDLIGYLRPIPAKIDLFITTHSSLSEKATNTTKSKVLKACGNVHKILIKQTPPHQQALMSLAIEFGKKAAKYEIIGHYSFPEQTTHKTSNIETLLGEKDNHGGYVGHIFNLLSKGAKIIYTGEEPIFLNKENTRIASAPLNLKLPTEYKNISINEIDSLYLPNEIMFWGRSDALKSFLHLSPPKNHLENKEGFSKIPEMQEINKILFILASKSQGHFIHLPKGDSILDFTSYESQEDYSGKIKRKDIKILSYYLPQFHPTPENDTWHGKGFTEWTKVRSANPLFSGHYQQHIPHENIGYYLLEDTNTLKRQAEDMRKSGVHGQIFYHYWFSGKLILEKPAQKILADPEIKMPFCFCWANENWTRRWDGNEKEILLSQNYSAEDARGFILYLIPFFRDTRYIKIEDRPTLFIYRPSSIPDISMYIHIWNEECAKEGINPPYLVAVLTRGATDPISFGMNAGVERVLHDWTDGNVADIKSSLKNYTSINGSVLPYPEVADFYKGQDKETEFVYFRSLVPNWDNTPRYNEDAYVLHGSTPELFQSWLENSIQYTEKHLDQDHRFIVINAWNEWAEGAHLEPDTRFGYSYLNSIGRALSEIPYAAQINPEKIDVSNKSIQIKLSERFAHHLTRNKKYKLDFLKSIKSSSIAKICKLIYNDSQDKELIEAISNQKQKTEPEFTIEFLEPVYFTERTLEKMLQSAMLSREATVIPNFYGNNLPIISIGTNGSVHLNDAYRSPIAVYETSSCKNKSFRMRTDAHCVISEEQDAASDAAPVITTIIRIHKNADFDLLENSLLSLSAMEYCICTPLIAAQNLNQEQTKLLTHILNSIPWSEKHPPQIIHYKSEDEEADLRSKMLNESLLKVSTDYVTFLDYDDLLMPCAYNWLISRIKKTGKAVSFGRVFRTEYSYSKKIILERSRKFEYGYNFEDFLENNHAPIHSFLIDLRKIKLDDLFYDEKQVYMEDYALTLQIFKKENCDWDSLNENFYIGDYIHSVDRNQTLAFTNDDDRAFTAKTEEYERCAAIISQLRSKIANQETA